MTSDLFTAPKPEGVPLPPWVVATNKDGTADILPAMRPGKVLGPLPEFLATLIVSASNNWHRFHKDDGKRKQQRK